MLHVAILGIFINLIIGIWVTFYFHQKTSCYDYPFLQPIVHYTIFYNIGIFCLLIIIYLNINFPQNFLPDHLPAHKNIAYFCISMFEFAMVYAMARIYRGFLGKDLSSLTKKVVATGVVIFVISFGVILFSSKESMLYRWINSAHAFVFDNFLVLEIIFLIALLAYGKKNKDRGIRRISNAFAIFYLARYIVIILLLSLVVFPRPVRLTIALIVFMSFNIIPFLWLKYYFQRYAESMLHIIADRSVLEPIFEKYHISKREQEILKLILDGKSNKEIEDTLFISYHTVKNHVYNLYQKLEVKTRYELVHFFTRLQQNMK